MIKYEHLGRMMSPDYYRVIMTKRISRIFNHKITYTFPSYSSEDPGSLDRVKARALEEGMKIAVMIGQKVTINIEL